MSYVPSIYGGVLSPEPNRNLNRVTNKNDDKQLQRSRKTVPAQKTETDPRFVPAVNVEPEWEHLEGSNEMFCSQ